jgi:hypothetical protein
LVEGVDGVSGVLRNASHRSQSRKVQVLKTSLVDLDRQSLKLATLPVVALWSYLGNLKRFRSIIQTAGGQEGKSVDEWLENVCLAVRRAARARQVSCHCAKECAFCSVINLDMPQCKAKAAVEYPLG